MIAQRKDQSCNWLRRIALIFVVVLVGAGLQMTVLPDALTHPRITEWGRMLHLGIWAAIFLPMVSYSRHYIVILTVYTAVFVSAGYVPFLGGLNVGGKDIVCGYLFGMSYFFFLTWFCGAARKVSSPAVGRLVYKVTLAALILPVLMPLLVWGYWVVSGGYTLSSSILLTLFQTNLDESVAYMKNQNVILWGCGALGLCFVTAGVVKVLRAALHVDVQMPRHYMVRLCLLVFMTISLVSVNQDMGKYLPVRISVEVQEALREYRAYGEARAMREERLKDLKERHLSYAGGVFVLVIGESETRNHMQVYGYDRETTPWLQDQRENRENITFSNAYSNHTHTVPVLTYALSEKNQYNEIALQDAYSIVEAANAAGYETYWLSNQRKLGAWDTPVAEIGSTAQHQKWMNTRSGVGIGSDYYDDVLLSQIPHQCGENALIIIHLMGCHGVYRDRYPNTYFSGKDSTVDEYDDSIRYNDYILSQIYEQVHTLPNFKGMIYFSDHGDDADRGIGHEASKFTWPMARIPLVMWFSDRFQEERAQTFMQLKNHEQSYWTNDLLYDVLLDILGITGMPHTNVQYDLASQKYALTKEDAMTLHGSVRLADEDASSER